MYKRPRGKRLTEAEEKQIIDAYLSGLSTTGIMEQHSCGAGTIFNVLKRNSIPRRQRRATYGKCKDRRYFESIDTKEKAYFLGLLLADGSIGEHGKITITLQEPDRHILEAFALALGMSTQEVGTNSPRGTTKAQARLSFNSREMKDDLATYGVVSNKVHDTYLPELPPELMPHLVRGIFDGDGHVSKYIAYICGTKKLCEDIQCYLSKHDVDTYLYEQVATGVWYVKGTAREGQTAMLKHLYEISGPCLLRKYKTATETHKLD